MSQSEKRPGCSSCLTSNGIVHRGSFIASMYALRTKGTYFEKALASDSAFWFPVRVVWILGTLLVESVSSSRARARASSTVSGSPAAIHFGNVSVTSLRGFVPSCGRTRRINKISCRNTIPRCGNVRMTKSLRRRIMAPTVVTMLWKAALEVFSSWYRDPARTWKSSDQILQMSVERKAAG